MRILDPNFRAYLKAIDRAERDCQKVETQAWHRYFKTIKPYEKALKKVQGEAEKVCQEVRNIAKETFKEFKTQAAKDYFKNKHEQ
ncbi:hypothetical protein MUP46_03665 [Patescibacteria group bacterium]|nr:hypothetical protein [Patescibacteria group bacterium]